MISKKILILKFSQSHFENPFRGLKTRVYGEQALGKYHLCQKIFKMPHGSFRKKISPFLSKNTSIIH